ncbi:MAG: tyrosine-type recombinase/integrase [Planctomycetes bacterium]|nr:tyrosine-type recombinase/integrase [Planctomycetota bacterium]
MVPELSKVAYREYIDILHSLRATEFLNGGVDIVKVKELLGHQHVATTQVYDKRRQGTSESASHEMPF